MSTWYDSLFLPLLPFCPWALFDPHFASVPNRSLADRSTSLQEDIKLQELNEQIKSLKVELAEKRKALESYEAASTAGTEKSGVSVRGVKGKTPKDHYKRLQAISRGSPAFASALEHRRCLQTGRSEVPLNDKEKEMIKVRPRPRPRPRPHLPLSHSSSPV